MGGDVGQIFLTASLHMDHSISYALVCEKELSHMGKNNGNPDQVVRKRHFDLIYKYSRIDSPFTLFEEDRSR